MTAPIPPYATYVGDGTTTLFNFGFELLQAQDMTVWVTPFGQPFDPVGDIVTNYSVVINPSDVGGNITFIDAPALLAFIVIRRVMIVDVPTDFSSLVPITGPNLDPVFVRISMLLQQIGVLNIEALHYPENTPNLSYDQTTVPVLPDGYQWQGLNSKVIVVKNEENPDASTLRTELASQVDGADGAGMIGFYNTGVVGSAGGTTVDAFLKVLANAIALFNVEPIGTVKMFSCDIPVDYLVLNDGTLGSTGSSATYAGAAYQTLFEKLWDKYDSSYLNIFDSAGIPATRGVSASADFAANKRLSQPVTVGRFPTNAGVSAFTNSMQLFTILNGTTSLLPAQASGTATERYQIGQPVRFNTYGSLPSPLNTIDTFYVTPLNGTTLNVATTIQNSSLGIYATLTGGSGNSYIISNPIPSSQASGAYGGSDKFVQTESSIGAHRHLLTNSSGNGLARPAVYGSGGLSAVDDNPSDPSDGLIADYNATTGLMMNSPLSFYIQFAIKYQ